MNHLHPLADPVADLELKLEPHALIGSPPPIDVDPDRYALALFLQAAFETRGYRNASASDAVAAAKRGLK